MNLNSIVLLLITIFTFISLGCGMKSQTQPEKKLWKKLPLRTLAQREAGIMGGEGMQMVFSISYAPSNPDIAYFASNTSQVWKSTDEGYSWQSKRIGFRSNGGVSLVVDPENEDVVFVSGSRHSTSGNLISPVDGIYRTLDGGGSWQLVKQTAYFANKEGQHFVFDPRSFNGMRHMTVYAGTHKEGLLKSIDGGESWSVLGMEGIWILDLELNLDNSTNTIVLYVATKQGLYKVVDNGTVTISQLGNDLPDYPRTIALNPQSDPNNDIVYAAVGIYKVYKSTNGGQTFISKSMGLPSIPSGREYKIIDISKADYDYLYVSVEMWGGNNPFYSHDGGESWQQPTDLNVNGLHFIDGTYFSGNAATHPTDPDTALHYFSGGKITKSTNGGETWRYSGNGYMGARRSINKTSTYFDPANPDRKIFFLIDFGPAITEDNGDTWELLPIPRVNGAKSTPVGTVDPNNQDIIITPIGGWSSQDISKSTDGGQNWTVFENTTNNYRFISFHPQDSNYVYAGTFDSGSWISRDGGNTWGSWDKLTAEWRNAKLENKSIRAVYPGNGDIVYAFEACVDTDNPVEGCTTYKSILWRSDNNGKNWTQITVNPFKSNVYDVDIDPLNSNRLYVAREGGFWVFDGAGWTETGESGGIPRESFGDNHTLSVNNVVVDPVNTNIVYAGMWAPGYGHRQKFIYRSIDYGQTWQDIGYNLGEYSNVWSLAVDPESGDLYICIDHGNYVLPRDIGL